MRRPAIRLLIMLTSLLLCLSMLGGCNLLYRPPDAIDESESYLVHALQSLNEEMILESIESGADLNRRGSGLFGGCYDPLADVASLGLELRTIRMLLENGFDVNRLDSQGLSPLMRSCGARYFEGSYDIEYTRLFLKYGGNPALKSREGLTALDYAIRIMDTERIGLLVSTGCDVSKSTLQLAQRTFSGMTDCKAIRLLTGRMINNGMETGMNPLEEAAVLGNSEKFLRLTEEMQLLDADTEALKVYIPAFCSKEALQVLIRLGVDCPDALSVASENGNLEMVQYLVGQGANLNKADSYGYTPLYNAVYSGEYGVAALLLENGASLENRSSETYDHGMNLATMAAGSGDLTMLKLLVECGLYLNDSRRFELINSAMTEGGDEVIEYLLGGLDLEQNTDRLTESLETACDKGLRDIAWMLIRKGADVNGINRQGAPLYYAVFRGNTGLAEVLIQSGAEFNTLNKNQETALMTATRYGYFDLVRLLVENGTDVNWSGGDNGESALTLAAQSSNHILRYLLEKGAYLNYQNAEGDSALMAAVKARLKNNVTLILEKNPDTSLYNSMGMTAYDIARAENNRTFTQLLMGYQKADPV